MARSVVIRDRNQFKDWLCVIGVSIGAFLVAIDATATSTALPQIRAEVGIDIIDASWVTTAYLSSEAVSILITAGLVRRFGHEVTAVASILLFAVSSVIAALATDFSMMIIGRLGQGGSGGTLAPIALAAVKNRLDPQHLAIGVTLYTLIVVLGPAVGPSLGGFIAQDLGWRWIFYLNVPIGFVAILLIFLAGFSPSERRSHSHAFDWMGMVGYASLMCPIIVLMEEHQSISGGLLPPVFRPLLIQIFLAGLFMVYVSQYKRAAERVINLKVIFNVEFLIYLFILSISLCYVFSSLFYIPIILQENLGYSVNQVGGFMLISGMSMAAAIPLQIALEKWAKGRTLMLLGLGMLAISALAVSLVDLNTNEFIIIFSQIMRGSGQIFVILQINKFIASNYDDTDIIDATSIFNITFSMSGAIGIAVAKIFIERENLIVFREIFDYGASSNKLNQLTVSQTLNRVELISYSNFFYILAALIMLSAVIAWVATTSMRQR